MEAVNGEKIAGQGNGEDKYSPPQSQQVDQHQHPKQNISCHYTHLCEGCHMEKKSKS